MLKISILEKKLPIEEFNKWMNYVLQLFEKYNINFNDYIKKLDFIKTNESLTSEFFKYCLILKSIKSPDPKYSKVISIAKNLFESNILGPICFVTPELGRWSTVGGLGVMVDELSQGLRSIGQEIIMISPYYNQNRKGKTDYLANDPFNIHYTKNVSIQLDNRYEFGVHYGEGNNGIKYYFLHNASIFPCSTNLLQPFKAIVSGPPARKPTIGVPQHNDSAQIIEKVSFFDVKTVTIAPEYNIANCS